MVGGSLVILAGSSESQTYERPIWERLCRRTYQVGRSYVFKG